jgi:hypothetical protein
MGHSIETKGKRVKASQGVTVLIATTQQRIEIISPIAAFTNCVVDVKPPIRTPKPEIMDGLHHWDL